ncbi:MAG: hypothetical protein ACREWE_10445, partial [Gammaproteobacteria bacterium]
VDERLLDRVERAVGSRDTLNGGDVAAVALRDDRQAGVVALAVDEDRAPFLVPARPARSRSQSSKVSPAATSLTIGCPFTLIPTVRPSRNVTVSPAILLSSPALDLQPWGPCYATHRCRKSNGRA